MKLSKQFTSFLLLFLFSLSVQAAFNVEDVPDSLEVRNDISTELFNIDIKESCKGGHVAVFVSSNNVEVDTTGSVITYSYLPKKGFVGEDYVVFKMNDMIFGEQHSIYINSRAAHLDEKINDVFSAYITDPVERIIFVSFSFKINKASVNLPVVLVWLLAGALFFTIYFKFANIKLFKIAIQIVSGKYSNPDEKGEVSHFQALTAALSGTVGLGNIAGVAVAISLGGPGATFWMIVAGLLGMSSKFVECTLGVKYRKIDENGKVYGGPMYYLEKGFQDLKMTIAGEKKSYSKMGRILAVIFAIACIGGSFGGGNMFQANQAFKQFSDLESIQGTWFQENGWFFGVAIALIVGIVILGGIKSIAKVTDKIVPFMVGIYVLASLVVLGYHFVDIPEAMGLIVKGAFAPLSIGGGVVGVMIQGFKRAAFSNEAGVGSASIAHSAVKTNEPASEGIVALLEPFIDTVVVCTMTALVLIITGMHDSKELEGVALTSAAFGSVISWFPKLLTLAVILFAFSTMISWSYYGIQAWTYLFGKSKASEISYKFVFCLFIVVGAAAELGPVIGFSDAMIFLMCFPNIFGMIFLVPVVKKELQSYLAKIKSGEIQAVK